MNTPDTEWREQLQEKTVWSSQCSNIKVLTLGVAERLIQEILTSRDTYWKERIEEERERICDAIDDYFISPNPIPDTKILCGYIKETLEDNLK